MRVLCRLHKLGFRFTSEKQQALLRGDTSGAAIHPFFIYCAQILGMYFCEGMDHSPAMVQLRAKHSQMADQSFADILKRHDWELMARLAVWIMGGSIVLRLSHITHLHIRECCEAVNTAGLQFIPTYGRPPEFSEGLHENLSVLSQIIYFENFLFLTCGGAEPTMTVRLEEEFRHQLPV